jgi:hypothetical protein
VELSTLTLIGSIQLCSAELQPKLFFQGGALSGLKRSLSPPLSLIPAKNKKSFLVKRMISK